MVRALFTLFLLCVLAVQVVLAGPKKYLFFDTETVGLPKNYDAPADDTANWPRMVQLSWIFSDDQGQILNKGNYYVRPNGFEIPVQASKIHGITTEIALKEGLELDSVLSLFVADLHSADYLVGHNVTFDIHVVEAEMIRMGFEERLTKMKSYCTMLAGTDFCKLPGYYGGYKWPKLKELYNKLFGCDFERAHNSAADIEATFKCFWEMRKRKLI
ncbi:MAG: 3'-5' exonuclease [Bacteroidales bacterium]|nr:3'-5' exonuclease [Bacteroidales bacterium]